MLTVGLAATDTQVVQHRNAGSRNIGGIGATVELVGDQCDQTFLCQDLVDLVQKIKILLPQGHRYTVAHKLIGSRTAVHINSGGDLFDGIFGLFRNDDTAMGKRKKK